MNTRKFTQHLGWQLISRPSVQFILLGTVLFVLNQLWLKPVSVEEGDTVVITAPQVIQLRTDWRRIHGRLPDDAEEQNLINNLVDDEILFQEALRIGLDRNDLTVRRRLMEKMRLLTEDSKQAPEELFQEAVALELGRDDVVIRRSLVSKMRLLAAAGSGAMRFSEAEIESFFARHRERFRQPECYRLAHVFLSRDQHMENLEMEASRLIGVLNGIWLDPDDAVSLGDPFLSGHQFSRTARQLERIFGSAFVGHITSLETASWQPVPSAYGIHLVWLYEIIPSTVPDLDDVRDQVLHDLLQQSREDHLAEAVKNMRARYLVRVEVTS